MKRNSHIIAGACVLTLAVCLPITAPAQGKKASPSPSPLASTAAVSAEKTARAIPFRGNATALDASAKTFTVAYKVGPKVFKVTDKTAVTKAGTAATFADLKENDVVSGSYWKHEDGTLELKSLKIGGKTDAEKAASGKKSKKGEDEGADESAAPSPSPSAKK